MVREGEYFDSGREEVEKPSLESVEQKAGEELKKYFNTCEYVPYGKGKFLRVVIPKLSNEDRVIALELLEVVGILAWDEEDGLQIEGEYDIAKLRLLGLIDERKFIDISSDEDEEDIYNPYAFPLSFDKNSLPKFSPRRPKKQEKESEETEEVDIGLKRIIEEFESGASEVPQEQLPSLFADVSYFSKLSDRYVWKRGYFYDSKEKRKITEEEQQELLERAQRGDASAIEKLLRMHSRLVLFSFRNFSRFYPVDDSDNLLQAGFLGLYEAIRHNQTDRGAKFGTYAIYWIDSKMRRAWKQSEVMHIPEHVFQKRNKYHVRNNRAIDPQEKKKILNNIAQRFGYSSVGEMEEEYMIGEKSSIYVSPENIDMVGVRSSDYAPQEIVDPEEIMKKKQLRELIDRLYAEKLDQKQATVLRMRFIDDMTLEQVGSVLGITKERVRQIESKALVKLRRPSSSDQLAPFVEDLVGTGVVINKESKGSVTKKLSQYGVSDESQEEEKFPDDFDDVFDGDDEK